MDLGLKGKRVVVTGGSKGIGRAIALAFAREGANIATCARTAEALELAAREFRERGVTVYTETADIGEKESLEGFLEGAHGALGGIDILVNNASGFGVADNEAGWDASFRVDVMAAVRATALVAPWMAESGGGAIVHISSISGMEAGSPAPYAAAKAALFSHAKTMAPGLAAQNIRINTVAPGSIEFPGGTWDLVRQFRPDRYQAIREAIPFGRLGRPDEVADVVVFLCSERASWVSGAVVAIDGCQHKGNF